MSSKSSESKILDESSIQECDEKILKQMKNMGHILFDLEEKLRLHQAKVKHYKNVIKEVEKDMATIIGELGGAKINLHDEKTKQLRGKIYEYEVKRKEPLSEGLFRKALIQEYGDQEKVDELIARMHNMRKISTSTAIKRTKARVRKTG